MGVDLGFRKILHVKFLVKYLSYKAELIYNIILVVLMLVDQKVLLLLAMLTTLKKRHFRIFRSSFDLLS